MHICLQFICRYSDFRLFSDWSFPLSLAECSCYTSKNLLTLCTIVSYRTFSLTIHFHIHLSCMVYRKVLFWDLPCLCCTCFSPSKVYNYHPVLITQRSWSEIGIEHRAPIKKKPLCAPSKICPLPLPAYSHSTPLMSSGHLVSIVLWSRFFDSSWLLVIQNIKVVAPKLGTLSERSLDAHLCLTPVLWFSILFVNLTFVYMLHFLLFYCEALCGFTIKLTSVT